MVDTHNYPDWWNPEVAEMQIIPSVTQPRLLLRRKDTKSTFFSLTPDGVGTFRKKYWIVYRINLPDGGIAGGSFKLTAESISLLFGLDSARSFNSNVESSLFVRSGPFINIPARGGGKDDDWNLSLLVTQEIQDIVRNVLAA